MITDRRDVKAREYASLANLEPVLAELFKPVIDAQVASLFTIRSDQVACGNTRDRGQEIIFV